MNTGAQKATLNPRYLLIAVLPALVFSLSSVVIATYIPHSDILPARVAEFDAHRAEAARVGVLATLMLFMGAASAALFFFVYTLRMFDRRGRVMPILAFVAMAAGAIFVPQGVDRIAGIEARESLDFSGRSLACLAAGYDQARSDGARSPEPTERSEVGAPARQGGQKGVAFARVWNGRDCQIPGFKKMMSLGSLQLLGVVLSFAGLVIGAICCLATPGRTHSDDEAGPDAAASPATAATRAAERPPVADGALQHWERQSEWLNIYLYLVGFLLATALLFLNAYGRWPGYVLLDATRYHEHVAALVSYYGIVFSIMLAAFYIPVALILSAKVKALKSATSGESKLPAAFQGPLQILKIVLGLFSTAIAGALPGILDMI